MRQFLLRPYPLEVFFRHRNRILVGLTLFIALFHLIFQPFQLRFYPFPEKIWVISMYTLISFCCLSLNFWGLPYLFPRWFDKSRWRVWQEVLWISWNVACISIGIFWFKVSFGFYEASLERVATMLAAALAVGSLPVVLYECLNLYSSHRSLQGLRPPEAPAPKALVHLVPERGGNGRCIPAQSIIAAASEQNYVRIYYVQENKLQEYKFRQRLYVVREQCAPFLHLHPCHRAFLVNPAYIESCQLWSHKGTLTMVHLKQAFPISRKYVPHFRAFQA
ncbi:MAG: LytTR family DNA-binding domain-containing protein [Bacteroidota bacterium]